MTTATKNAVIEDEGNGYMLLTCNCQVCGGRKARNKGNGIDPRTGRNYTRTFVHNVVCIAYSPFAKAQSQIACGPWAVV